MYQLKTVGPDGKLQSIATYDNFVAAVVGAQLVGTGWIISSFSRTHIGTTYAAKGAKWWVKLNPPMSNLLMAVWCFLIKR
jgi:hypothetical protein